MSLLKYIFRYEYMDYLISCESTGSPEEFAEKVGIRRSTLLDHIKELRSVGLEIRYSHSRRSYYYSGIKQKHSVLKEPFLFAGSNKNNKFVQKGE